MRSELIGVCPRKGGRFYLPLNLARATDIQVRPRGNVLECKIPRGTSSLGVKLVPCRGSTGILVASVGKRRAENSKTSDLLEKGFLEKSGVRAGSELRCIEGEDVHMLPFTDAFQKFCSGF